MSAAPGLRPGPTVYLVDDDEAVRDSLSLLLESHGMTVHAFESCPEFLASYVAGPNACLVLDLHLPVMGGLDLLEAHPYGVLGIPVIVISGRADGMIRGRALASGAVALLDKPFEHGVLLAAIKRALDRGAAGRA